MNNEECIAMLSDLVSLSSISGTEGRLVDYLEGRFIDLGMKAERLPSGSICAVVEGTAPGPTVVMDGHIDTVGIPDAAKWTHDPFRAELSDGKIYGRGTSDMKGAVAAMTAAASAFVGKPFSGRIVVSCIVEEERFEGIAAREVTERFNPDYVVIGEATEGRLNRGQRGRCEVLLAAEGRSCHSSNPEEGKNAVLEMMKALSVIESLEAPEHPVLGKGILALTDIISSPYPGASVIPEKCFVTFDRLTLIGEDAMSVLEPINSALAEAGISARARIAHGETTSYTGMNLEADRFFPSWLYEEESEVVRKARRGLESAGLFKAYGHYSFCTNGSHYAGEAGIPTVGYGPGAEKLAHIVDEYVPLEDMVLVQKGYEAILKGLLDLV